MEQAHKTQNAADTGDERAPLGSSEAPCWASDDGNVLLYHADCLSILPLLSGIDAVITDPPYELSDSRSGKSHYGMSLSKFDSDEYKSIINGFDYCAVFSCLHSICKPFNAFCFCSNKQISKVMGINESAGFATTLLVWHKTNSVPFANGTWRGDIEYCVHARGKGAYFQGNADLKKKVTSLPTVQDTRHPTVKPLPLISKFIMIGTDKGHTVLDPFMGSGTTGIACIRSGRKFIGIEKDAKYFEVAKERIRKELQQGRLF